MFLVLSYSFGIDRINIQFHTLPWFPRKPNPIPDQNGRSLHSFSDQKGPKTLPFEAAHTYMAYIREFPPPPGPRTLRSCYPFLD